MIPRLHYEFPKRARYRQVIKSLDRASCVVASIAIVAVMAGGFLGREAQAASLDQTQPGRFGRMFQYLPPFAPPSDTVRAALMELGKPGGLIDARDNLGAGPAALIVDPLLSLNNPNNPAHTAGTTFMGQFLDHDMTFDPASPLGQPTRPVTVLNARNPF